MLSLGQGSWKRAQVLQFLSQVIARDGYFSQFNSAKLKYASP